DFSFSSSVGPTGQATVGTPLRGLLGWQFGRSPHAGDYINKTLTDVSSWIDWTACARSLPTLSTEIFLHFLASLCRGIVLVTMTSIRSELRILSTAGPERTGCVQHA